MLLGHGEKRAPWLVLPVFLLLLFVAGIPAVSSALSISAYPDRPSVVQGDAISFHVSTDLPDYDIHIYRFGAQVEVVSEFNHITGHYFDTPADAYANGCNWPAAFTFTVPAQWRSGAYAVAFSRGMTYTYTFFVVRPKNPGTTSKTLYVVPVNTYQAYNTFGGKCLYDALSSDGVRSSKVSFERPYLVSNGLGQFEGYEQPFVQWMEKNGIVPEYCTSLDLDQHPELLNNYSMITTAGHDEYWTMTRRLATDAFVESGRNLALFSANACYWAIRIEDNGNSIVCYKDTTTDPMTSVDATQATCLFRDPPLNMPENKLFGVMYASNSDFVGRPAVVLDNNHWIFAGTSVQNGDSLGKNIVGYEWDNLFPATTPTGVVPLLQTSLNDVSDKPSVSVASYFEHSPAYGYPDGKGGKVFAAGTVQWSWGLDDLGWTASDPNMQRITLNVLQNLAQPRMTARGVDMLFRADTRALHLKATDVVTLVGGNPAIGYSTGLPMSDDGTGADSVAGDGIYSARVTLAAGTPVPMPYGYRIDAQQAMLVATPGLAWPDDGSDVESPQVLPLDVIARPGLVATPTPVAASPSLRIESSSPNPFRGLARISYLVPGQTAPGRVDDGDDDDDNGSGAVDAGIGTRVSIRVYDAAGRNIRTLFDGYQLPGENHVSWDGRDASGRSVGTGIYFCRAIAGGQKSTIKMLRVR